MIIVRKNKLGEEIERFNPQDIPVRKIRRNLAKACARRTKKHLHTVWPEFTRQHTQTSDEDIHRWNANYLLHTKGGK